jgi:glycosyltransferase involved in cell wall biosynthesis
MPDATIGWLPYAVDRGRQLLAEGGFDAIFSSSGPPSSHIVAARLQRASGLPWIADYRDLWSGNHWDYRVAPFRWVERGFERRILRNASLLTTVSSTLAKRLADLHLKPAEVVFNGFDPADYPEAPAPDPDFTVTYVGSLYWPDQDPAPLLAAVALVKDRPGIDLDGLGFCLQFLGTEPAGLPALAQRHGVDRWVRFAPGVPHPQSLARQTSSTALAFLGWSDPNAGIISAKIFEYLGAGRPIIAVGPPGGATSEILRKCGMSDLSNDPQQIAHRLESWLLQFQQSRTLSFNRDPDAIAAYTRRAQTGRLAGLLDRVSRGESAVG